MSATSLSLDVARELRSICGAGHVTDGADEPRRGAIGADFLAAVEPASAEEVAAILRIANQHHLAIVPAGGSTQQSTRFAKAGSVILRTNRLQAVEHYDHSDLTVGVGAGMTVAQLNRMVGADRLLFACDPALPHRATVGGILATGVHGPLRHGYGGLRDFCIGIRFVTGDARTAKGGGRVVKNVAGYDLMKLLIGSYGTLVVITSASFKLFPSPRQTRTFLAEFASADEALHFRDLVLRSPLAPMCLELVSPGARKLMRPVVTADAWVICIRAAGSDVVLARYRAELGSAITREVEGQDETAVWRALADFPITPDMAAVWPLTMPLLTRIVVNTPVREVGAAISALAAMSATGAVDVDIIGRVGVGHLAAAVWPQPDAFWPDAKMIDAMCQRLPRGCSVALLDDSQLWRQTSTHLDSMRAVKRALDPNNVLNPARSLL